MSIERFKRPYPSLFLGFLVLTAVGAVGPTIGATQERLVQRETDEQLSDIDPLLSRGPMCADDDELLTEMSEDELLAFFVDLDKEIQDAVDEYKKARKGTPPKDACVLYLGCPPRNPGDPDECPLSKDRRKENENVHDDYKCTVIDCCEPLPKACQGLAVPTLKFTDSSGTEITVGPKKLKGGKKGDKEYPGFLPRLDKKP